MATSLVYVCCLCDGRDESYIEFAMMLMSLTSLVPGNPRIHVHFAPNPEEGLKGFQDMCTTNGPDEIFVCMPTTMSSTLFLTRCVANTDKAVILGVHPVPVIDWQAVEKGMPPYCNNISAPDDQEWVLVPNDSLHGNPPLVFKVDATVVCKCPDRTRPLWQQWEGPVFADNKAQLTVMGKNTFSGCVGYRRTVR